MTTPASTRSRPIRATPSRVFVAISCGGVWETLDAGKSWTLHGKGMVATYLPPEQAGRAGIARPASRGALRRRARHDVDAAPLRHFPLDRRRRAPGRHSNCRCDDFGFAVAAHPKDPLTAWFVPAIKDELRVPRDGALAVTRTRDGGKTWRELRATACRSATPSTSSTATASTSTRTGRRLAMGSTTGSLWVSDNAGEAWQLVNAHLPPVYAVRLVLGALRRAIDRAQSRPAQLGIVLISPRIPARMPRHGARQDQGTAPARLSGARAGPGGRSASACSSTGCWSR